MNSAYHPGDIVLGNWKLKRLIGEGSFGKVFEAERKEFDVVFKSAIKVVSFPSQHDESILDEMDEADRGASLRCSLKGFMQILALMHKLSGSGNIVSQADHAIIEHKDGIGWDIVIRMELLTPLPEYLREAALSRDEIIKLGVDLCKALEICQRYNIIHRDIKPSNIFVSESGAFKLGDFGIARLGEANVMRNDLRRGFCTYMAPEMWSGEPYGGSVDIYSLGVMLYSLLNDNRPPFLPIFPAPVTMTEQEGAFTRRMKGEKLPPPKNADWQLASIVCKACAYRWKDRFESPTEMRKALENAATMSYRLDGGVIPAPPWNQMDGPTVGPFDSPTTGVILQKNDTIQDGEMPEIYSDRKDEPSDLPLRDTKQELEDYTT